LGTNMAYQCIPLATKEYQATLSKLMETPAKAKKFSNLSDKYKHMTKAIRAFVFGWLVFVFVPGALIIRLVRRIRDLLAG